MATLTSTNFGYSGSYSVFTAPYTGEFTLEVWGAEGANRGSSASGGHGGYSKGKVILSAGEKLYVYVGGYNTGFNGGGYAYWGGRGGGATDIRRGGSTLNHRIIVAGGGGSVGASNKPGGYGGGPSGQSRGESYGSGGQGATQSSGGDYRGTFGQGGDGTNTSNGFGGAGGGGWYGGGGVNNDGSGDDDRGGGGGSGYIGGVFDAQMINGGSTMTLPNGGTSTGNTGHGYARITYTGIFLQNVKTDISSVLAGEEIKLSWDASAITVLHDDIMFDVEVNTGTGWTRIHTGLAFTERTITYKIPAETRKFNSSKFRVRCRDTDGNFETVWEETAAFIVNSYLFVVKSDDKVYTYRSNNWVELFGEQNKAWYITNGLADLHQIPETKWSELNNPVSLLSFTNSSHIPAVDVTVPGYKPIYLLNKTEEQLEVIARASGEVTLNRVANPKGQFIIQKKDSIFYTPTIPRLVRKITFKGATVGTSTSGRRVAISVDKGLSFFTWDGSAWENIGELTDNESSKERVRTSGMTIEEVNARTEEDWYELFKDKPRHVRFAYYLEMDLFNTQLAVDEVELLMDVMGSWEKVRQQDYEYSYPNDKTMQIELFANGSYKINY